MQSYNVFSVYDAVKCFNGKDSKDINKLMSELGLAKFTTNELTFLYEFETISKPIADAIDNLQSNDCYYSVFLPTLFTVKSSLEKLMNGQKLSYCIPAINAIYDGLMKRFGSFFDLRNKKTIPALIATCSDPYFKLRWLPKELASKETIAWIQNLITNAVEAEIQRFGLTHINNNQSQDQGMNFVLSTTQILNI